MAASAAVDQTALEEATAAVTAAQTALDNAPSVLEDAQAAADAAENHRGSTGSSLSSSRSNCIRGSNRSCHCSSDSISGSTSSRCINRLDKVLADITAAEEVVAARIQEAADAQALLETAQSNLATAEAAQSDLATAEATELAAITEAEGVVATRTQEVADAQAALEQLN